MRGMLHSIPYVLATIHKYPFHFLVKSFCMDIRDLLLSEDIIAIRPHNCFLPVKKCYQIEGLTSEPKCPPIGANECT